MCHARGSCVHFSAEDEISNAGLPLGKKLSFFTPDSEYHGGPGAGFGIRHFSGGAIAERGQSYEGQWKDDEQEGYGKLRTHAGTSYEGEWKAGEFHGEGTYVFQKYGKAEASSVYAGQWSEGKKHGKGKLTLYSGNSYDGEWVQDKRDGWGLYTIANPTIGGLAAYEGEWVQDARTGRGISKGYDGHLEICTYKEGLRVGEGVRIVDESKLKKDDLKGPFALHEGKLGEEISLADAEAVAASLGFKSLPTFPWPPAAAAAPA